MLHLQRNARNAHQPRRDGGRDELYGLLAGRRRRKKGEKDAPLSVLQNGNIGTEIDGD